MILTMKFLKIYMQLLIQICTNWVLSILPSLPRLKKGNSSQKRLNYSPRKLNRAISEIKEGNETVSKVSKRYGIPRTTLLYKLNGKRPEKITKPGPKSMLDISKQIAGNKQDEINQIISEEYKPIPYNAHIYPTEECLRRSEEFYHIMVHRRSVRYFSSRTIPQNIIRNLIKIAGTSPSGANSQPWVYAVVSDSSYKKKIRRIIEEQEEINYKQRMGAEWVSQLKPLNTNWIKEYLTDASHIIMLFKRDYNILEDGTKIKNHYSDISTNISIGILLAAIQYVGLVTVTTTPLSCGRALQELLERKSNEKLVVLLPVGYPADNVMVPDIKRKELHEIIDEY